MPIDPNLAFEQTLREKKKEVTFALLSGHMVEEEHFNFKENLVSAVGS